MGSSVYRPSAKSPVAVQLEVARILRGEPLVGADPVATALEQSASVLCQTKSTTELLADLVREPLGVGEMRASIAAREHRG